MSNPVEFLCQPSLPTPVSLSVIPTKLACLENIISGISITDMYMSQTAFYLQEIQFSVSYPLYLGSPFYLIYFHRKVRLSFLWNMLDVFLILFYLISWVHCIYLTFNPIAIFPMETDKYCWWKEIGVLSWQSCSFKTKGTVRFIIAWCQFHLDYLYLFCLFIWWCNLDLTILYNHIFNNFSICFLFRLDDCESEIWCFQNKTANSIKIWIQTRSFCVSYLIFY